ncbi:nuclear transport factor 2 family protein [Sphaerisporangium sp. NPDC051011]|uniref:nuclear transport factor 2 family protein n=1 Tax=Sphaerisporangium sp. NPDC051011 TaxID=3155792 RepID=UPI0033CCF211
MSRTYRVRRTSLRTAAVALGTAAMLAVGATAAHSQAPVPPPAAGQTGHDRLPYGESAPRIAKSWLNAWNAGDAEQLASLFTADGTYTDHAFGASFTGPEGVAQWVTITTSSIENLHGDLRWAYRHGDEVVIGWTFNGHLVGAPSAFSVPAVTVMRLKGAKIKNNDDYYSRAEVLRQSGLPADWAPSA